MESARHTSDMCPAKGGVRGSTPYRESSTARATSCRASCEASQKTKQVAFAQRLVCVWKLQVCRRCDAWVWLAWLLRALCCASAQPVTPTKPWSRSIFFGPHSFVRNGCAQTTFPPSSVPVG
jgi:hypothetical protein